MSDFFEKWRNFPKISENFQKIRKFRATSSEDNSKVTGWKVFRFFLYISDGILSISGAFPWYNHAVVTINSPTCPCGFFCVFSDFVCSTHMHQFSIPDFSEKKTFSEKKKLQKKVLSLKSSNPEGFWLIPSRKKVSSFWNRTFFSVQGVESKMCQEFKNHT